MVAAVVILIVLIICVTVLGGIYISSCSYNNVGVFDRMRYDERIMKLEKEVEALKKK